MKTRGYTLTFVMIASGLLIASCLLPGMIPLSGESTTPMPMMEKDTDKVIEVLNGGDYNRLDALAAEQYTEEDTSKPGTLVFTVKITDDRPTYFNYGWCTTTEEILTQNFQHITVKLYINGDELGSDVIHPLTLTRADGLVCFDYGVLLSEWEAGDYQLEVVASFEEIINDGLADYAAGDYVFQYNVTVEK